MCRIGTTENRRLQLHIYILGYHPMGESQLIIVYERDVKIVHKAILIDCFEQKNVNRMASILEKYNINTKKLDYIIWTHPDRDHSVGFDNIIRKYSDDKTLFILPDGVTSSKITSKVARKALRDIKNFTQPDFNNLDKVSVSNHRTSTRYKTIHFDDGFSDTIDFYIEVLTPFSGYVFKKQEYNRGFIQNDISLSVLIHFGALNFYFGGDSENGNISLIDSDMLKGIDFIKIPHHSSSASSELINKVNESYIANRPIIAVSTSFSYGKSHLPNTEILNSYKDYCDKILLTQNDCNINKYGICKFVYNIQSQELYLPETIADSSIYYYKTVYN